MFVFGFMIDEILIFFCKMKNFWKNLKYLPKKVSKKVLIITK